MFRPCTIAVLACAAPMAQADTRYIGVFVGSLHVGSDAYNNVNPGLTYGMRRTIGQGATEWHAEGGVFYNSYEEISPIAVIGLSTGVAEIGPGTFRMGASFGTAYYGDLVDIYEAQDELLPNIGGFVPIGILTGAYRTGRMEYRLNVLPYGEDVDGVVNFSVAVTF
ncbi:hypothetical protein JSE7799_00114 [Jannaschia seosinensis]|uniref:Outer membrane protein beta-barrel domain-containing protein n=1 Tax=Jannaschia seosinensis TaxID=313367 RepID=A0A0M7B6H8_9RHOB|nr:hypothetical protein [Jannaschia seosinensis]CUH09699.1 hypothetical protein JSE7799_00114 [Jannaschia seosinensis]